MFATAQNKCEAHSIPSTTAISVQSTWLSALKHTASPSLSVVPPPSLSISRSFYPLSLPVSPLAGVFLRDKTLAHFTRAEWKRVGSGSCWGLGWRYRVNRTLMAEKLPCLFSLCLFCFLLLGKKGNLSMFQLGVFPIAQVSWLRNNPFQTNNFTSQFTFKPTSWRPIYTESFYENEHFRPH